MATRYPHVTLRLLGDNEHPLSILGRAMNTARDGGVSHKERDAFMQEALRGSNAEHLLATCREWFNLENLSQHAPETISVIFARKPVNVEEVIAAARNLTDKPTPIRIIEHRRMSELDYRALANDLMGTYEWMRNKGGWDKDQTRLAIKVTCPGELTLYIDPSGAFYGRYVGLEV